MNKLPFEEIEREILIKKESKGIFGKKPEPARRPSGNG